MANPRQPRVFYGIIVARCCKDWKGEQSATDRTELMDLGTLLPGSLWIFALRTAGLRQIEVESS